MPVRVKIDEDQPLQTLDLLAEKGYEATTLVRQGWQGLPDEELWSRVQTEGRWLITADKGFADLRAHPPGTHAGVLLFRLEPESRRAYLDLARRTLEALDLAAVPGAVVVASPAGIRIRKG
jgi:predicted nuclease of predicted toxin-antitoxin system